MGSARVIGRQDQSNDEVCKIVVGGLIQCMGDCDILGVLPLQILCEIIFTRPELSTLCEDGGFIENTLWEFNTLCKGIWRDDDPWLGDDHANYWRWYFLNVILGRTNNTELKGRVLDRAILKSSDGDGLSEGSVELLFGFVCCEIQAKEYDFGRAWQQRGERGRAYMRWTL
jgi:hypothetical protein